MFECKTFFYSWLQQLVVRCEECSQFAHVRRKIVEAFLAINDSIVSLIKKPVQ